MLRSHTIAAFTSNLKRVKGYTYLSISWRISGRSWASFVILNFFPNGISEITLSKLSEGNGNAAE